jgi:hypothetical protein
MTIITRYWWLTLVILATWEAEIWKITVQGQPGQKKIYKIPSQPITGHTGGHLSTQLLRRLRLRGLWFQASLGKKVCEITFSMEKKLGIVAYTCYCSYSRKHKIGLGSRLAWPQSETLSPK